MSALVSQEQDERSLRHADSARADRPPVQGARLLRAMTSRRTRTRTPRWVLGVVSALLTAVCILQDPGKLIADTKLPLAVDPRHFLGSALHLWDPGLDFGTIQNQSVGYAFPMGSFFLVGRGVGLAAWLTQRLWLGLLLAVAMWGIVRLAEAFGIGRPSSRVVAGLAYSCSPFMLTQLATTSAGLLGLVTAPWALLPLVLVCRRDAQRLTPRRAAALSGVAIAAAGGVNASVTLAAVMIPALWLLICRGPGAWKLRAWWSLSVVLACAWWLVPLALQGRYGMNFVTYSETVPVTTSVASAPEALRGTGAWLAYLVAQRVWLPAGLTFLSSVPVILASWVVTLGGLVGLGLLRRRRPFLLALLGVGTVLVAAGYAGPGAGLLDAGYRSALGGVLSPVRNVVKFEPLVRLPLALGLAHLLAHVPAGWQRRRAGAFRATAVVAGLAAVAVTATPLLPGRLTADGSFTAVPGYWREAADWMAGHGGGGRTLVIPGSAFGEYEWGRPLDEPMAWLSSTPWGTRSVLPLGGEGSTRLLDGIEAELVQGEAPHLDELLRRSGVSQVLVRHDLDPASNDPRPTSSQMSRALQSSGLMLARTFGPVLPTAPSPEQRLLGELPTTSDPRLEVWQVPGSAQLVDSYPAAKETVLSGGSEAVPTLAAQGILGQRPVIMAGDLPADRPGAAGGLPSAGGGLPAPAAWFDTDTLQRRDEEFGQVHRNVSQLLAAGEVPPGSTAGVRQRLNVPAADHQTVARYEGVASVTASSSGFPLAPAPVYAPFYALDGNDFTAWQAAANGRGDVGQWLQVRFLAPKTLPFVTVRLLGSNGFRPKVTGMRVTTDRGSVDSTVAPTEDVQLLRVPPGSTSTLRVTFTRIPQPGFALVGPGIRELGLGGVTADRVVVMPHDAAPGFGASGPSATGGIAYVVNRARTDPAPSLQLDEEAQLSRQFVTPRALTLTGTGSVLLDPRSAGAFFGPARQTLACGSGPAVVLDGHEFPTAVTGSGLQAATLRPVALSVCTPPGGIPVPAGTHELRTLPKLGVRGVDQLVLATPDLAASGGLTAERATTLVSSTPERRTVALSAGPAVFLAVHENFNASWSARLGGHQLQAVRLDGWQQGYLVPAGEAGTVVLTTGPGRVLRWGLAVGAGLAAGLLLLALSPVRGAARPVSSRRLGDRSARVLCLLGGVAVGVLVSWPAALAVPLVVLACRVWSKAWALVALAGAGCAAVSTALHPGSYPAQHIGAFGAIAVVAGAVALVAVVVGAEGSRRRAGGSPSGSPHGASTGSS